jgi:DNA repair exonuclease SbcCD ATPase subunit
MSALEEQRAEWLGAQFWERLDRLEGRHQRIQSQHEAVRRGLERVTPGEAAELRSAWRRYCEVIAELEQTAAEFESLRTNTG